MEDILKNNYRIGYSFWGFTGDNKIENNKEVSSPCGNATYSYSLIYELLQKNCQVYQMMPDRDFEAVSKFGIDNFKAFSQEKRWKVYSESIKRFLDRYSELDVLLLEWRFKIPGRNCISIDYPIADNLQPDLKIQADLLLHYTETDTKIIFWDLDHKLTYEEEKTWCPDAIFETALYPKHQYIHRTSVNPPCLVEDLLQFPTEKYDENKELVYIGSRYERDDVIDQYIKYYAKNRPGKVHFYGNWLKYPDKYEEALKRWPGIIFNDRITVKDFHNVYKDAIAVPLLGKRDYFEHGFITPRIAEAVMFGSVPVGFKEQKGIESVVYSVVNDSYELMKLIDYMKEYNARELRRINQVEMLEKFDAKYFVDEIEKVLNK